MVTTSSTRTIQRPCSGRLPGRLRTRRNAPATLPARAPRSSSNWRSVARCRSRTGAKGSSRSRAATWARRTAWSIAALAQPAGVDRHRHDHVATGPGVPPARGERAPERLGETPLAAYLSAWSAARTGPANELHHSSWRSGAGMSAIEPDLAPRPAARGATRGPAGSAGAEVLTLDPAAGARRRQRQIEEPLQRCPDCADRHAPEVSSRALTLPLVGRIVAACHDRAARASPTPLRPAARYNGHS